MKKGAFEAIATLTGTTIGAGILGIPYVVAKAGFLLGLVEIILIGLAILLLNLFLGEVVLRTEGNHQLTGYAEKYLGKNGKIIMSIFSVILLYGACIAYIIGVGLSLASIFPQIGAFWFSVIYFAAVAIIIYFGIKLVKDFELFLSGITIFIIFLVMGILIFSKYFSYANLNNFASISPLNVLIPYGVILFAFLGAVAIPEMKEELTKNRKQLKKCIIIGTLIPLVVYAFFAIAVVGVSGLTTSEIATIHLGELFGEKMIIFANLFAAFAMTTSFLALGVALKETYQYDFKLNKNLAWLFACIIPISAFLLGVKGFIATLTIVGAIAGGIEGILIVLMHHKAKKLGERKPEYSIGDNYMLNIALIVLFVLGVISQLLVSFKLVRF